MKKILKRVVCILSAFVFAFSPLFFAGCNFSELDDTSSGDSGGSSSGSSSGEQTKYFNVDDYLGAIKMSFTNTTSVQDADEETQKYAEEVSSLAQIQAADILTQLFFMYGNGNGRSLKKITNSKLFISKNENADEKYDYCLTPLVKYDDEGAMSDCDLYFKNNEWMFYILLGTNTNNRYFNSYQKFEFWDSNRLNIAVGMTKYYNEFIGVSTDGQNTLLNYNTNNSITNTGLLTYAILSIIDNFWNISDNATESEFNTAFNRFITSYDAFGVMNKQNQENEIKRLALNVKHSGIVAGSMEEKALIKFVRNYVVGETIVNNDNTHYQVWKNGVYVQPARQNGKIIEDDKFQGESYYYNSNANDNDVSIYLHGNKADNNMVDYADGTVEALQGVKTRLEELKGTFKLWQDINNDGFADIVMVEGTNIPKFRPLEDFSNADTTQNYCFKNYEYTIEQIVKNVAGNTDSLINNKTIVDEQDSTQLSQEKIEKKYYLVNDGTDVDTSVQVEKAIVSNVFSKDYKFSQIEATGEGENSCVLPKRAYKSMLICAKDRSGQAELNNAGTMMIIAESSKGVQVNLRFYARYYRHGSGFAQWYNSGISGYTEFYELNDGETQSINGPYGFEYNSQTGQYEEGCFFEMDISQFFKDAKFGLEHTSNNKTFDYTYTSMEDGKEHTKKIYELEMFPDDYYSKNSATVSHSSVFIQNYQQSPKYDSILTHKGEQVYCYSEENFKDIPQNQEIGFLEIVLVNDSDNPFTIGITGYAPQTALLG